MGIKRVAAVAWAVHKMHFLLAAVALTAGLAVLSVFWQVMYPPGRALPAFHIGGIDVGNKDRQQITTTLADYAQSGTVIIRSPSKDWNVKWQNVGISVDPEASADAALSYQPWERAIPFSSLIREAQSRDLPLVAIVDQDRLTAFAQKLVTEDKQASKDAVIRVQGGTIFIDQAKNGYQFTVDSIKQQLQAAHVGADTRLTLVPDTLPARPASDLADARLAAEIVLQHSPTLKVNGKKFILDSATIGSWLTFPQDDKTKKFTLGINRDAIKTYLATLDKEAGRPPGTSTVTLIDGQEIARTPADNGLSVANDANVAAIDAALRGQPLTPPVNLVVTNEPPHLTYVRTYSTSDAGLLATIKDWQANHYGSYSVIVRELGGQNRYAEVDPDHSYVTASTFKLFVYYAVEQRIQGGSLSYNTMTDMGWTVDDCLTEMIVHSTNPCAISLMNLVGWQWTEDVTHQAGFANTFVNNQDGGDKHSTVRDETNYMTRLYYGTLYGQEANDRLTGYLKRQIWRDGIPSGVPRGTTVADKVGFYDGWVHDIGIIYGPKSHYILGIMSHGGADADFADLSHRVYNFFQN